MNNNLDPLRASSQQQQRRKAQPAFDTSSDPAYMQGTGACSNERPCTNTSQTSQASTPISGFAPGLVQEPLAWDTRPGSRARAKPASRAGARGSYQTAPGQLRQQTANSYNDLGSRAQRQGGANRNQHIQDPSTQISQQWPNSNQAQGPGQQGIETTTDTAGEFFKHAEQMLGGYEDNPMLAAWQRPPPAGMRGALSWGVGPNAYENDGRPGTRSGGIAYDLEGRPLTRSGIRPPSRMHMGLTGTQPVQATPSSMVGSPSGSPAADMRLTTPKTAGPACLNHPSNTAYGVRDSQQRPSTGSQDSNTRGSAASRQQQRGGQRQGTRPVLTPVGQQRTVASPMGKFSHQATGRGSPVSPKVNVFKVEEEKDVDAFLETLSGDDDDDETDAGSMDDLQNYLRTLDQRQSVTGSQAQAKQGSHASRRPEKHDANKAANKETQVQRSAADKQHDKAVKLVRRLLDVLVEQAMKTSQVNAIIKEAEQKALADDITQDVVLSEQGWQDSVRGMLGASVPNNDCRDFDGLLNHANSGDQQLQSSKPSHRAIMNQIPQSAPRFEDEFKHVMEAASDRSSNKTAGRYAQTSELFGKQQAAVKPRSPGQPYPSNVSGMARYTAHRV